MNSQIIWESIKAGDIEARNQIWSEYQHAVDFVARRLASSLPKHVSFDDLRSAGQFGLLDAINKFDPSRGYKFETYALTRIRGAILDDLRTQDWVPRSVRQRDRSVESAVQDLTNLLGRLPDDAEVASFLEIEVTEVSQSRASQVVNSIYNIDQPIDEDGNMTLGDTLSSESGDLAELFSVIDQDLIIEAISHLPRKEELTLTLHYRMGLTLAEIGRHLDVTESRVCQIHTSALKMVRRKIMAQ